MKTTAFLLAFALAPLLTSAEFCFCSFDFHPVCGSDGKTYGNPCAFWCANLLRTPEEKITIVCTTACEANRCSSTKYLTFKNKLKGDGMFLGPNPLK